MKQENMTKNTIKEQEKRLSLYKDMLLEKAKPDNVIFIDLDTLTEEEMLADEEV